MNKQNKTREESDEILEIIDLLKDSDVKSKNLFVRVYNTENGKQGWISLLELVLKIIKEN